ncbi:MAG: CHAT domain-containing protein [Dermatophilaceae bacterium]
MAIANRLIEDQTDPYLTSVAHQAAGIVKREAGDLDSALGHLDRALREARSSAVPARVGDVLATLGVSLVVAGRTRVGLTHLGEALSLTHGLDQARVRVRRANALLVLGRPTPALDDLRRALRLTRREHDQLWEGRCYVHLSWARWMLGQPKEAERDALLAERLLLAAGQHQEAAWVLNNLAYYTFYSGDLPGALALVDAAEHRFAEAGPVPPHPAETRCRILLTAGLAPEALETAVTVAADPTVPPHIRAELLLVAAAAALALGDTGRSTDLADEAIAACAAQRRESWLTRARFVRAQALAGSGRAERRDLRHAVRLATVLTEHRAPEAPLAHLLAGRLALHLDGWGPTADQQLRAAADGRHTGSALSRSTGWLAAALRRAAVADTRGVLHACRRGLDALDEYRRSFGDTELRALATDQGRELSELALATVVASSRHRDVLWWSERWRATALAATPVHPPEDPQLAAALAAAREAGARLVDPAADAGAVARAERDRARQEAAVRRRTRQLAGTSSSTATLDVAALVTAVGSGALVSLVDVRGRLYAVLVTDGRVTRHEVGATARALRESEFARFTLRRTAFGRPADLAKVGALAQGALLGDLAATLPERVVVVPPAALHATPWGLLPAFAHTRLSVAPSARLWLQARARPRASSRKVSFVTGPGLTSEATEAATVSRSYAGATVLSGGQATVAAAVPALEGASLAHVAAHGTFRADAPMFSCLHLADGPLYVHDLDRLRSPPHTLVLSACDAGDTAAVGVDEGLGLVTSLLGLGTSAVLASVVPVNDAATIPVMGLIHGRLAAGDDLASALQHARVRTRGDPAVHACAMSFTAWAP